ncbi:hypothetical protein EGR_02364 [Echinococcus granulosus]|uniref:Uncharacterized protein n=1 Tax=Echinococcus granulosus TaxID=6210 RepID=W6UNT2_ECHGR|nr:hypothetical protein EGR_02364 [Echinococcus granulosus]EUB62923.1 hypothetical protein EGR_02364 [Echinococcus granulosus]
MRVLVLSNLLCLVLLVLFVGDISSMTARLPRHRFPTEDPYNGDFFDAEAGDDDNYEEVPRPHHHSRRCNWKPGELSISITENPFFIDLRFVSPVGTTSVSIASPITDFSVLDNE